MSIEVVPQPRIDHLVPALDGGQRRRTDHHGVVWFGGRQAPQTGSVSSVMSQAAAVVSPFWLPDSLAYRTDAAAEVVVSASVGLLFVADHCHLAEVQVRLAPNPQQPEASWVSMLLTGSTRVPLGVSYSVTVLAPVDAVLAPA